MSEINIPKGYNHVMPYLIIEGAATFIEFTRAVFGAEEIMRVMRDENKIMHAEIRIGDSVTMCADATNEFATQPAGMFIYVKDADATYAAALAHGATSLMAPSDQEYGRSSGIKDPSGNTWYPTSVKAV